MTNRRIEIAIMILCGTCLIYLSGVSLNGVSMATANPECGSVEPYMVGCQKCTTKKGEWKCSGCEVEFRVE